MKPLLFEVPGYQIIEELSENAAYKIFRGHRIHDLAPVRIKVLDQSDPTPRMLAPLWQEFEILRLLDFPGVEKAYALETHQQRWMIVLEDPGDPSIGEMGIAGCFEPKEFLILALQLAEIVAEIHAHRVIHKNISPSSIYFNSSTQKARLTNFGYASLISNEKIPLRSPYRLTEFLAYISPELTGRMNRSVDYRTDYYSLGVTLYELLSGSLPFTGESPLELVHAHLALLPNPPASRMQAWKSAPTAFQMLSAILLKLLAKNPEDRYQTPTSLQTDLHQCLTALQDPDKEGSDRRAFTPGQADRSIELNLPQLIIGREQETDELVEAFLRTIGGPKELVLVSGEGGVGKTTLANQLIGSVAEHKGLFLYSKYDQAHHHMEVYPLLVEVLEEFCRQVLSEPTASFNNWRESVQSAVSPHGGLLTDLCPDLEKVIGPQPPVETAGEESVRIRFQQVVIRFLQAICRPEHPVVILLDDLTGISSDSYLLWKSILTNPSLNNLLVVGAYRDNEVGPESTLFSLIHEIEEANWRVTRLHLKNLDRSLIQGFISSALASDPVEISELTGLVYQKTEGNPHFTNEFLKSLHRDQLLVFDLEDQQWRWDANRIDEYGIASNVVDFFVHEIVNLDKDVQKTLQYAALIGRRFNAATLLAVFGRDKVATLAYSLRQAMRKGLIDPLDEYYLLLASENMEGFGQESAEHPPSLTDLLGEEIFFEFQHDRVQQAAIAMLDEQQLGSMFLQIGWTLLEIAEQRGQDALQHSLLDIVDHLNRGRAWIEIPTQAIKAAQLNLMASNQARAAGAFAGASRYLVAGMQLLPVDCWQAEYSLTLELFTAAAEVAMLNGDMASAEALALSAEDHALTFLEKVGIMKIRLDIYVDQNKLDRAIELGIAAINQLEFDLEVQEPPASVEDQILHLADMTEPRALAVSQLTEPLISAAYATDADRFVQLIHFYLHLFSRFGNPPEASLVYISYGVNLLSQFKQIERGCRIGRAALELAEKQGRSKTLYAVRFTYFSFIHHWLAPAGESLTYLEENIQPAFESGSLGFSKSFQDLLVQNSLLVGLNLEYLQSKQSEALLRLAALKQESYRLEVWSRVVLRLMQESHGDLTNTDDTQQPDSTNWDAIQKFNHYAAQAYLSLFYRDAQRALANAAAADEFSISANTQLLTAHHVFIHSLALLSIGLDSTDLTDRLKRVEENLRLMRLWAGLVPENYLHQIELVEAELARALGRNDEAARSYELSIRDARKNGYVHYSALAAELAAEFYLVREDASAAKDHLLNAYHSYLAWGATAKVKQLENRYPEWLPPQAEDEEQEIISAVEDHPMDEIASAIDLNTILKASIELTQETSLPELLRKLMAILIENAGAQNGSLILYQNDRWFLRLQGSTDPEEGFVFLSTPLDYMSPRVGEFVIPTSIIHYVINLKEDLVLEDASTTRQFGRDPYVEERQTKSILCAPLMNQGVLSGVIYLENNLVTGAFTSDRLEIVRLISGQAAVSIERARLYETMEAQVEERTRELSAANRKLKEEINERIRIETALSYNEALLRKVLEILPVGVWILDKSSMVVSGNPEALSIWSGEKFVKWQDFENYKAWHLNSGQRVRPEDWAGNLAITHRLITLDQELEIETFNGLHRIILNSAMPLLTAENELLGAIVVNQDITERKHAEKELQTAHDQLSTLLDISQSIVSTLDIDLLLNLIIEQLGKVLPYEAAAIMILEQDLFAVRVIRGPSIFQSLLNYQIPTRDLPMIDKLLESREAIYLPDLQAREDLINMIQENTDIPASQFALLRSWLLLPLIAKGDLVGIFVLTHSQPDYYSLPSRIQSQAYTNQVAIAIHNAQLYKQAGDHAALEERNRLARELHDSVAQALYSISLFIDATRKALNTHKYETVESHLRELTELSQEAISDMRLLIHELRPVLLEKVGLVNALQGRLQSVEARAGHKISFESEGEVHLSLAQENELYRIAQEALNNILKHAQAKQVWVKLTGAGSRIRLTIEDDGIGFDPSVAEHEGGQGLNNMRERAARIGAICSLEPVPGKGTKITVEVNE
ncbi:MAG TPA: AAA family ATPase [Anaerolineales bacterium]|nr:AAA family ATPase [Anaerolineales bacterium]